MSHRIRTALLASTLLVPQANAAQNKTPPQDSPENAARALTLVSETKSLQAHIAYLASRGAKAAADEGPAIAAAAGVLEGSHPVQDTLDACRAGRSILVRDAKGNPEFATLRTSPGNRDSYQLREESLLPGEAQITSQTYPDPDAACEAAIGHTFTKKHGSGKKAATQTGRGY